MISKKILIKAIRENQFDFIKELWVNGHNIKSFYLNERGWLRKWFITYESLIKLFQEYDSSWQTWIESIAAWKQNQNDNFV